MSMAASSIVQSRCLRHSAAQLEPDRGRHNAHIQGPHQELNMLCAGRLSPAGKPFGQADRGDGLLAWQIEPNERQLLRC